MSTSQVPVIGSIRTFSDVQSALNNLRNYLKSLGGDLKGQKGDTGTSGTNGTRWHVDTGAPVTIYNDNDLYLDSSSGKLYQQQVGAWVYVFTLIGGYPGAGVPISDGTAWVTSVTNDISNTRKFLRELSVAGVFKTPVWDTILASDVPTLNQNTTGTAANLSGTPALPNGTTTTTQSPADDSTKLASTAYVDAAIAAGIAANEVTGVIKMYGGATAPSGYLLCDGASYLRSDYTALFNIIGTNYGAADGTHFNVPDLRGRVPIGVGTGAGGGAAGTGLPTGGTALTAVVRGTWKGEETHALSTPELAIHSHTTTFLIGSYTGYLMAVTPGFGTMDVVAGTNLVLDTNNPFTIDNTGSGTAHNTIQPVMGVNFIIKT